MELHPPLCISARLLPAIKIGKSWLSLAGEDGKIVFWLDVPAEPTWKEYKITGLRPGIGEVTLEQWFECLLSFMGAAAEAYKYEMGGHESDNGDLFEPEIMEWTYQNDSEISMVACDLQDRIEKSAK